MIWLKWITWTMSIAAIIISIAAMVINRDMMRRIKRRMPNDREAANKSDS
jgi:flagellar biosynthesis/type III secretory pathway M-ring protein FliF/YscJ